MKKLVENFKKSWVKFVKIFEKFGEFLISLQCPRVPVLILADSSFPVHPQNSVKQPSTLRRGAHLWNI